MTANSDDAELRSAVARQQIMELRLAYGVATDLIGTDRPDNVARGREIYRRIFTADAHIAAEGIEPVSGPDAWLEVVRRALARYSATQHLIGTQYVTDLRLPDAAGGSGSARMSSYLQAWHSNDDDRVWLYLGTYEDELRFGSTSGWQIERMMLHRVAADYRLVGRPPES